MKKKILVVFMAMFFISATFAGAVGIKIEHEKSTDAKNDPAPCPAVAVPPGLWNTGFENGGKINLIHGKYKKVDKDQSLTFESEISFYTFGGVVIGIPSTAEKITIKIKERKDGGAWNEICNEPIYESESNSDGRYMHKLERSYSEDGVYQVEVSAISYNGDKSWETGGGRLYTLTTVVGNAKSKSMQLTKLLDMPVFQLLNLEIFF